MLTGAAAAGGAAPTIYSARRGKSSEKTQTQRRPFCSRHCGCGRCSGAAYVRLGLDDNRRERERERCICWCVGERESGSVLCEAVSVTPCGAYAGVLVCARVEVGCWPGRGRGRDRARKFSRILPNLTCLSRGVCFGR